jgi:hypothetical protein
MILASEVAIAIIITNSSGISCKVNIHAKIGTITVPPPIPNKPAVIPAIAPNNKLAKKNSVILIPNESPKIGCDEVCFLM